MLHISLQASLRYVRYGDQKIPYVQTETFHINSKCWKEGLDTLYIGG